MTTTMPPRAVPTPGLVRAVAAYREASHYAHRLGLGSPGLLAQRSSEMAALRAVVTR